MNKIGNFRMNGAIGALLDEYEKSIHELEHVISGLTPEQLIKTIDSETNDEDCISIQSILTHVVRSGYNYAVEVRKWLGQNISFRGKTKFDRIEDYQIALQQMFEFNESLFTEFPNLRLNEHESSQKIKVRWGQEYDLEQLFEHAIVHVLRHRRQIEIFKRIVTSP